MSQAIAIVLAAGKGTRMNSDLPKVLCTACGRPLIDYVLDALSAAGVAHTVVVVGYEANQVKTALSSRSNVSFAVQEEQNGTGHAVKMCQAALESHDGPVLIVAGDSPMIQTESVGKLLEYFRQQQPACLLGTLHKDDPQGLGRIVRDEEGAFVGIVEEKDADERQKKITEVNMSMYVFDSKSLLNALGKLKSDNKQNEYYLTDCPGILKSQGKKVEALPVLQPCEALSVNTVEQLEIVEQEMRRAQSPDSNVA